MVVETNQTSIPCLIFFERPLENIFQREIHHALQTAVETISVFRASLIECRLHGTFYPAFAHNVHVWIFFVQRVHQFRGDKNIVVRVGVDAQTIDSGKFNPIDIHLAQIVEQKRVRQIQVGHVGVEPAFFEQRQVFVAGVVVGPDGDIVVGAGECGPLVQPSCVGQIAHPPMRATAVVWHNVFYQFQAAFVALVGKAFVVVVGAKPRVDAVVVRNGVVMVRKCGVVVGQHWRGPHGGESAVGNVIQMVDNALNITTLALIQIAAYHTLVAAR